MDWKSIIADLQRAGYTQPQIAAACKCAQATVSDLANGKTHEPRHSLGEALRALHRVTCRQAAKRNRHALKAQAA